MKKLIILCLAGVCAGTFGATATFTGAASNQLKVNGNWDTGTVPVNQHVVFASDGWTTRNMVTTGTGGYLNIFSATVSANVNSVTSDEFQINGWNATSRIFSYNGVTVESGVSKNVRLSGYWGFNGNINANPTINHYGSGALEINTLNFAALNTMNTVSFRGDNQNAVSVSTFNQNWTCTTFLNNVNMSVNRASAGAAVNAIGTGLVSLSNGAKLSLYDYAVLGNSEIRVGEGCSFDVSGVAGGVFTNSAVLQGLGAIVGDVYQTGQFRAGPGAGDLTFDGNLTLADSSWSQFEITDTENDCVIGDAEDTIIFEDGAALQFAFNDAGATNGSSYIVISGFGDILGEGVLDISVTGLDEGLELDTTELLETGRVTVIPEPATVSLFVVSATVLMALRRRLFY